MSSILSKTPQFNELPENVKTDIKCFFISKFGIIFFVTNNDHVYVLPKTGHAYAVGRKSDEQINECFILFSELCNKKVCEFFEGNECFYAKTDSNQLISWGSNKLRGLGRENHNQNVYLSPGLVNLYGKKIVDFCCAESLCSALTMDGHVLNWGMINYFQPFELSENYTKSTKFISIHSIPYCMFALNTNNQVLMWGTLSERPSRLPKMPGLLEMRSIIEITSVSLKNNSLVFVFILNKNGEIFYLVNSPGDLIDVLSFDLVNEKCLEIEGFEDILFVRTLNDNCQYFVVNYHEMRGPIVTKINLKHNCLIECFSYEKTIKTLSVSSDGFLMYKIIEYNSNSTENILVEKFKILNQNNGKFAKDFKDKYLIGYGQYGRIYRTKNLMDKSFAIKKICINTNEPDRLFDEYRMLSKLNSKYVVEVESAWIEDRQFIFIQMELCLGTLKDLIDHKEQLFNRQSGQRLNLLENYISIELFVELIECLNYLHSLKPPIIHRDLKPTNVLYTDGKNGRLLKLCDFGLAKLHQKSSHSQGVGTHKYMAPEVMYSRKYNPKADVFSLGVIGTEIFDFNIKENATKQVYRQSMKQREGYSTDFQNHPLEGVMKHWINKMLANNDQRIEIFTFFNLIKNISVELYRENLIKTHILVESTEQERTKLKNSIFFDYLYSKLKLKEISEFLKK